MINSLNDRSGEGEAVVEFAVSGALPPYLDVSGDNRVTPLDVLLVVYHLNKYSGGEGEYISGEGESSGGEGEYVAAALAGAGEYVVPVDAAFEVADNDRVRCFQKDRRHAAKLKFDLLQPRDIALDGNR